MNEVAESEASKHEFPCQACGANLVFAAGTEHLRCEYCGHEQKLGTENQAPILEYDFKTALAEVMKQPARSLMANGKEVRCTSCGAMTVTAHESTRCAFCDSPVVLAPEAEELIPPESLLPFKIELKTAREAFKSWVKSRWFAPNDLKHRAQVGRLDGVYLPYWTYDAATTTAYTGRRGTYYYVTENYRDSNGKSQTRRVRKTKWTPAFGTVRVPFDDVLVPGTGKLPRPLLEKLEPWDLHDLKPYDPGFLAGFLASRYDINLEGGFHAAKKRMEPVIQNAICRDIGGDTQEVLSMQVKHDNVRFKHFLLPLWISSFRYREKVYRFIVNARTGEAAGERPWSWIKITLAAAAALAVVVLFLYLSERGG